MLIADLDIRIIDATTGELTRQLTFGPVPVVMVIPGGDETGVLGARGGLPAPASVLAVVEGGVALYCPRCTHPFGLKLDSLLSAPPSLGIDEASGGHAGGRRQRHRRTDIQRHRQHTDAPDMAGVSAFEPEYGCPATIGERIAR
jgi:hypothetical protein